MGADRPRETRQKVALLGVWEAFTEEAVFFAFHTTLFPLNTAVPSLVPPTENESLYKQMILKAVTCPSRTDTASSPWVRPCRSLQ